MTQSQLFSPLTLRGLTLKNRIMVSPMAQYAAVDGEATDWHLAHFAKFALGGAGLVFMEATKVERRGLGTVGDMGLWKDDHVPQLRRIVDFLHAQGAAAGIQFNHAGRKAGTYRPWEGYGTLDRSVDIEGQAHWEVIGPSAIRYMDGWPTPREMSEADIEDVIEAFAQAARRADEAGFDVIEIHGAHGYLLHQFLSPASNQRTDRWGGGPENRRRFPLEVACAIRARWPSHKPLFFRISSVDEAGWTLDDSVVLARELKERGVDAMDCSAGGLNVRSATSSGSAPRRMGHQVPYADRLRRDAGMATVAVGLIIEPAHAESVIAKGQADLVAVGREMLFDPFWAHHAAAALGVDPEYRLMAPVYQWWLDRRAKAGYERPD
ncbi:MAG: NADH:flavin oxidoreductase/NADH oxidase [Bordetella sp.]|nr:NADH:flavin oxidoreductase/NADH oxidase [Bordetella sp.]